MLDQLKDYLRITWDEEDFEIERLLEDSKKNIKALIGTQIDFNSNAPARTLLFDYCRYARNYALEHFENNFSREILRLQLSEATKFRKEEAIDQ